MRVMSGRNAENYFFSNHLPVCSGGGESGERCSSAKQERCQELSVYVYEKTDLSIGILHILDGFWRSFHSLCEAEWEDKTCGT